MDYSILVEFAYEFTDIYVAAKLTGIGCLAVIVNGVLLRIRRK